MYFIVHVKRTSFLLKERCVQSPQEIEGSDGSMGIGSGRSSLTDEAK